MAGKRHLESLDPMIYNKIPRLETEPNRVLPGSLCKSSPLPSPGSENHLTYKGSYFAYPLQNHDGTESLAHWSSAAAYMQYAGNAVNQHLRTDGAVMNCLLYRREPESMGGCLPSSGAEKGKDSMVRDLLMAREQWANHVGHQDPLQQAQGHAFPLPKPVVMNKAVAQAPTGCATLAVPKPVYRTPICYVDPRTSVSLGSRMESLQKRSMEMEWTLPAPVSSGHHPHLSEQHCGMAVHKKAHHPEPNFLPAHQGTGVPAKETLASTVGFSPYSAAFEKYRAPKNTSFLETNYPAVYNQKNCTEVVGSNLTQNAWSKMYPSTTSPRVHSPASVYQERLPPCYPLSHYPPALQKQTLLYHQEGPHAEKQNGSLSTLPSSGIYKGFGFLGSGDPRAFPNSYLRQQLPRSYYPGPLESYVYRAASSIPTASSKPSAPSREPELQKNTSCKMDFLPQSPSFPFASPDLALYNTSLGSSPAHHDQHVDDTVPTFHGTPLVKESPSSKQMASHHSAFQAVHSLNRLTEALPKGEMGYGLGLCPAQKPSLNGLEPSHPDKRRSSSACRETKPRSTRTREAEPGAPIVIADSPVPHHHQSKRESSKVRDFTEGLIASPQIVSSEERQKGLRNARGSPPSPPMPVINNVFSLAPYRDYLEGPSEGPGESPCSKNQQREDPAVRNTVNSLGSGDSAKPVSEPSAIKNVSEKNKLLPAEKEAESRASKPRKMSVKEGDCYKTSSEPKQLLHSLSMKSDPEPQSGRQSAPAASGIREVIHNEVVLDLSLKKKLAKSDDAGRHAGQTEGMPKREEGEQEREASLKKQEVCEGSKTQALPLQAGNGSGDKSNFHSSAAFMFKKFKILKSLPAGTVPSVQPSSPSMQQSYPMMTPLTSAPMQPSPKAAIQANTQQLQITCLNLKLPDISEALPPSAPEVSPVLGEANVSLPSNCESPAQQTSSSQYFTSLHMSLCNIISYSVCGAPPELLKEWLKRAEPDELKERPKSPPKHKNGSRILEAQKSTKSKEIWLDFKDASVLLSKLLSQLETFMFTRKCPFPHVVRAGAIFIPIHVVKEKLFPKLLGLSVDQVLQEHKVELRPTTLSEEKLLRDLELKCCTSRMLKLLALKQLPDIYPDLLTLHWHDCIKQQLGPSSQAVQQASKALDVSPMEEDGASATRQRLTICGISMASGLAGEPDVETLEAERNTVASDSVRKKEVLGTVLKKTPELSTHMLKGKRKKEKFLIASKQGSSSEGEAAAVEPEKNQPLDEKPQESCSLVKDESVCPQEGAGSPDLTPKRLSLLSGAKKSVFQSHKPGRTLQLKLTSKAARKTRSTSRVLHLRNSVVQIKFQRVLQQSQRNPLRHPKEAPRRDCSLLSKTLGPCRHEAEASPPRYPELVGKRIRHLYEEKDKTEAWYQGVVLRVHKQHKDPLKTVYEVKYDSEPEWQYYLEILQDYKKGWLKVDE